MRKKRAEKRRIRRLKIRTLFMLSFTLIFNTYAWFLYVTTVSTNMTVHVESWSVNFTVDDTEIERELLFAIEEAYPGMQDVNKTVTVTNTGESLADVKYNISRIRIFDDVYVVTSLLSVEEMEEMVGGEISVTEEELLEILEEDYPFKIIISSSEEQLATGEFGNVTIQFSWAYESGNDELDTQYGIDSFEYYQENEGKSPIEARIKIKAQQHRKTQEGE